MNHGNGAVRASGANAPAVPDRLLALTTEALAFVSRDRAEGVDASMAGWRTLIEQQSAIGVGKVAGAGTGAERAFPEGDNSFRPARPCDEGATTQGRR